MFNADKKMRSYMKRKFRIRKKIKGTEERPRLNVYRSNRHIYAQIINDTNGETVASASSLSEELNKLSVKGKTGLAKKVSELIARTVMAKGIDKVVFDRGAFLYHGRLK